ncbi:hypothetical protein QF006_004787 [Pantoea agglomerans]|nr:hypothetical protein [Pantoea agglomerans]
MEFPVVMFVWQLLVSVFLMGFLIYQWWSIK